MTGVPETPDRTDAGTTLQTAELSSPAIPAETGEALRQVAHCGESVAPPTLADDVRGALDSSGYTWLRRVVVATSGRSVALRGAVPSYHLKQLAQITVMAIPGVEGG